MEELVIEFLIVLNVKFFLMSRLWVLFYLVGEKKIIRMWKDKEKCMWGW